MSLDTSLGLAEQIGKLRQYVDAQIADEELIRRNQPLVRLWNAEWEQKFVITDEYSATFSWVSNDTGPGQLVIPFDSDAARWVHDYAGRINRGEGRNVCITVDQAARWSGVMDKYSIEQRDDGDVAMVIDFLHDYEHLKWIHCWSNPWLPSVFQMPRAFIAAGPIGWTLKLALLTNLARLQNPLLTWPDDPLDPAAWNMWDLSDWNIVVKPERFLDAMASGQIWHVFTSRWASWHDAAHTALEDAEMSVVCRRYLPGDEEPWPGAANKLRFGTLVVDIVDKSGVFVGTSHGGSIFSGLVRTVAEFAEDFVESSLELVADADDPADYWKVGYRYTDKVKPYVVFTEGETSPVETSAFINSPAKGVQILAGGHSAPGVNETISATVQLLGDLLGNVVMVGGLGGSLDALLQPLYEDTIAAWSNTTLNARSGNTGFERLHEFFSQGANQAWTIASLLVIRAGVWATKTTQTVRVTVADGLPFLVGEPPVGHFFHDDRIGVVVKGDDQIHMDRARKIDLAWNDLNPPEWQITVGDDRNLQDPAQRALGRIESLIAGLRDLGVY